MILLEFSGKGMGPFFALLAIIWAIPIIMIIVGLIRWKKRPRQAKTLIVIGGIWLLIAAGTCGLLVA